MTNLTGQLAVLAFFTPLILFALLLLLHAILPAWKVTGYAIDEKSEQPINYRLNGLVVFVLAAVIWAFGLTTAPLDWLWRATFYSIAGGSVFAVIVTLLMVFTQPSDRKNIIASLWAGRVMNYSLFGRVDVKMYLYIVGGTLLALNALSGAAYHYQLYGEDSNPGVFIYAGMWVFFVVDYFCFERVQLYTYDLIHEKLGFKLLWGCFVAYPYLYLIPLWGLSHLPSPQFSEAGTAVWLTGSIVLFLCGWMISRGANYQKYRFKRWPDRKFLGLIKPLAIGSGESKILASGFWGISRHSNYLGEIIMALALAVVFGHFTSFWAWLYLIYVVLLFVTRERADHKFCEAKYGEAWKEYCERTRYRIIPKIY